MMISGIVNLLFRLFTLNVYNTQWRLQLCFCPDKDKPFPLPQTLPLGVRSCQIHVFV